MEQNDNHFDGVINNQPQPDPAEILRQSARESEASEERRSVLEALKERQAQAAKAAEKANSTGSIYGADIADMQAKQDEIWETAKEILARLATIQ